MPKLQAPNIKLQRSSNLQNPKIKFLRRSRPPSYKSNSTSDCIDWKLGFGAFWSLDLGACCFPGTWFLGFCAFLEFGAWNLEVKPLPVPLSSPNHTPSLPNPTPTACLPCGQSAHLQAHAQNPAQY